MKLYTAAAVMAISAPFLPAVLAQSRRKRDNRHLENKNKARNVGKSSKSKSPVGNGKASKAKAKEGTPRDSYFQSYHNEGVMMIITNSYYNCPEENKRFRQRRLQEEGQEGDYDYVQSYHNEGISITSTNLYYCVEGDNFEPQPILEEALAIYEDYKGEDQGFSFSYEGYEGGDVGYDGYYGGNEGYDGYYGGNEGYEGGNEGIRQLRNKSYHNKYKHQRNRAYRT